MKQAILQTYRGRWKWCRCIIWTFTVRMSWFLKPHIHTSHHPHLLLQSKAAHICSSPISITWRNCSVYEALHSAHWRCWLGDSKGIHPVKTCFKTQWDTVIALQLGGVQTKLLACPLRMLKIRITGDWKSTGQLANPALSGKWSLKWKACVLSFIMKQRPVRHPLS